ncbi:MAG: B12-binding domain-containing radical SAM protein [Candidatus Aminicenantes bacterium]|nr:B12-binding domain-containing radical SAM protein [Candidatus Aminicenantes bacterium]
MGFFPPLGLEYIAASIEKLVKKVTIIDLRLEKEDIREFTSGVDLVGVSVNWGLEIDQVYRVINNLPKKALKIIGGRYATANVEKLFHDCENIDIIVRGDGEEVMQELIKKGSPVGIEGVSYRVGKKIVHNPNRALSPISDIYPNRKLRRYKYKIANDDLDLGIEIDSICSSRGCPYNCKFCTFSLNPFGQKRSFSARSPESILAEIKNIKAELVVFVDDNFAVDMKRVENLCDLLIKQRINKKYAAAVRIDIANYPEILMKMAKAGFRIFSLGIESTRDETLKQLNKGFTIEEVKKAFEVLRKFNFLYHGYFIIGNIGEDEQDMLRIASFAREIGLDTLSLSRLRCEKYSPLLEIARNAGYIISQDGRVYSEKYSPQKLNDICRQIQKNFYTFFQIIKILKKMVVGGFLSPKLGAALFRYGLKKLLIKLKRAII